MMNFKGPVDPVIRVDAGDQIEVVIKKANGESLTITDTSVGESLVINSFAALEFAGSFDMTKGIMLGLGFTPKK